MKIGSTIVSILLSALMFLNAIKATYTYAYYYLDREGFIEMLCVNKDKPEMQCNGKCHLKKVAESNENNDKAPEKAVHFDDLLLFLVCNSKIEFSSKYLKKKNQYHYKNLYSFHKWFSIDHPPQV